MFDADDHPDLVQATNLALQNGIDVALSNPCTELWFILHFEDQHAWLDRSAAQSRSEALIHCRKALTKDALELLFERVDAATNRAQFLDTKHEGDGRPPRSNPSSGMWRLIHSIRQEVSG